MHYENDPDEIILHLNLQIQNKPSQMWGGFFITSTIPPGIWVNHKIKYYFEEIEKSETVNNEELFIIVNFVLLTTNAIFIAW